MLWRSVSHVSMVLKSVFTRTYNREIRLNPFVSNALVKKRGRGSITEDRFEEGRFQSIMKVTTTKHSGLEMVVVIGLNVLISSMKCHFFLLILFTGHSMSDHPVNNTAPSQI